MHVAALLVVNARVIKGKQQRTHDAFIGGQLPLAAVGRPCCESLRVVVLGECSTCRVAAGRLFVTSHCRILSMLCCLAFRSWCCRLPAVKTLMLWDC
jgi:hypothetical protein